MNKIAGRPLFLMFFCILFFATLLIFRTNSYTQYVTDPHAHETPCVHFSNNSVITRFSTVYRKDLPPLQDALNTLDWDSFEAYLKEQRKQSGGNIYLPTSFYEEYLNILVPYLEQPVSRM